MRKANQNKNGKELVITRIFNAPRELVWKVWTEPKYVMRWWGPMGFTSPFSTIDLRIGGKYLNCMRSSDGKDFWSTGNYREIIPFKRIVATDSFSDEKGNVVPGSYYGMGNDFPLELLVTVTFEEDKGRTKFTLRHAGLPPGVMTDMTGAGWSGSFDKLAEVLEEEKPGAPKTRLIAEPGKQQAAIVRIFDAPRDRLFKAYTDPGLMTQWWAPRRFTIIVDKMDVRPGGVWRILNRDAEGHEFAFHGVYHEVTSPERLVYTFEFEGMPGHVILGIVTFEDRDGKTKVTEKSVFESVWDRDGMLKSGMEEGGPETMDRLAELVEKN
ncbi:MAG: SRPBCC domain-containing protein [Methanomicrobiales archaeon]|nr:SRPBCC domain-containing protein [Methanomicrobiales archaeon]